MRSIRGFVVALSLCAAAGSALAGTWPASVTPITTSATGKLESGAAVSVTWANKSSTACFPATENVNFSGNQVFYGTQLPAQSEMVITATPSDPKLDLSVYAYTISATDFSHLPPNVPSAVSCAAGYDAKNDSNPGQPETTKLNASTNAYNVVIVVAGANGAKAGSFTLKVEVKSATAAIVSAKLSATLINAKANAVVEASGSIERGGIIDLAWASSSQVGCFPATENTNFDGNHVIYKASIPVQSEMVITVTPKDAKSDLNLYAYTVGTTSKSIPPNVPSAVSCEAGYDAKTDSNPGQPETVKLVATTNPYTVYIGVAGAKGLKAGSFTLKVELKSAAGAPIVSAKLSATLINAKANAAVEASGAIERGGVIDLGWASSSQVACFPATENTNFDGNHVIYKAAIPVQSEMVITVTPKDAKSDLSLYAYTVGTTSTSLPPNVPSAVSCEAGYDAKTDSNPGQPETVKLVATTNPYTVYIGVAGAKGLKAGGFTLKVELKSAAGAPIVSAKLSATLINAKASAAVEASGAIERGGVIDLGWASSSQVGCFPATENTNFDGNHVIYKAAIPVQSEMVITVTPKDAKSDLSLYAYTVGTTSTSLPPNVPSAVSCEAGYDAKTDSNPGQPETVKLVATTNPYTVYIGVAGAKGLKAGSFTLKVELKSAGAAIVSAVLRPTTLTAKPNAAVQAAGSIDRGGVIDLAWAANSSVACFPATENVNFNGNHVIYKTSLPANSEMTITLTPKDPKVDLSLYAYTLSSSSAQIVPPNLTSAVSCEAGYDAARDANPGAPESVKLTAITNPYTVYIGVAGAAGIKAGAFTLKVELKPRS